MFDVIIHSLEHSYILIFGLAAVVCIGGVMGVQTFDHPDIRRSLSGLLLLNGVWSLATAFQLFVTTYAMKSFLHIVGLIAGISTVFAWLSFASAYSGRHYHRKRSLQVVSLVFLGFICLLKLTNPLHGLYFSTSAATEPFSYLKINYGPIHWFVTGFAYTASAVGFLWLFESFERSLSKDKSRPTTLYALVLVTGLPVIPYVLSTYSNLLLRINYEPLGVAIFAVGVVFYARSEFVNHSSPEKAALAKNFSEAGLVLDKFGVVINYNDRAARVLNTPGIPREPLEEIDTELASLAAGETRHINYEVEGRERVYEARRSQVTESLIADEVIILKDITRATRLEQLVRFYQDINEALIEVTDPWDIIQDIPERFAQIDVYDLVWLYPVPTEDQIQPATSNIVSNQELISGEGTVPGLVAGKADEYATWASSNAGLEEPVTAAARQKQKQHVAVSSDESNTESEWRHRAGEYGITDTFAVPMTFSNQQTYILGVFSTAPDGFDSAERRVIEEISKGIPQAIESIETHKEALQYKEAIRQAGAAISITDNDGVIRYVNPAFEDLTGYSEEEAVGSTHQILKSGEMDEEHYESLWNTVLSGDIFEEQIINKTKDGDRYIARQTISPVTDEDGDPEAFVAIQLDITDKILREQRLSVLNRVLRHNLRTAVNVITGNTTLLKERVQDVIGSEELPPEIESSVETIRSKAEEMSDHAETAREIEEKISKSQTDQVRVPIEKVAQKAEKAAESFDANHSVEVSDNIDEYQVDVETVQIIEELVENAVVHNDRPLSEIKVEIELSRADNDLVLTVKDNGPGLSDQELVVVEEGTEESLQHSSGLGLWMVNWLAISLGGSISATTSGDGTTVRVVIPLRGESTPS
ncbi:PAS domain S-box protein [Halorutilales archaeon Cl-col2-1]